MGLESEISTKVKRAATDRTVTVSAEVMQDVSWILGLEIVRQRFAESPMKEARSNLLKRLSRGIPVKITEYGRNGKVAVPSEMWQEQVTVELGRADIKMIYWAFSHMPKDPEPSCEDPLVNYRRVSYRQFQAAYRLARR